MTPIHRWQGGTLLNHVAHHLGRAPHPLHRLDYDTTGVVCFAKHKQAARVMSDQLQRREWRKAYWAISEVPSGAREEERDAKGGRVVGRGFDTGELFEVNARLAAAPARQGEPSYLQEVCRFMAAPRIILFLMLVYELYM